jgi:hypothetical protein
MSPLYGGLCGYEFPDGVPDGIDMALLIANLSAHGQDIAAWNSNDSVICFICFNGATVAHSWKTPSNNGDPIAATDPVYNSSDGAARERSGELLPDEGVDSGLDDMGMVRVLIIPSVAECEEEFSKQFYSSVDKRLTETQKNTQLLTIVQNHARGIGDHHASLNMG